MAATSITAAELAKHNKPNDMWLAVDGDVYDVTDFADMHPGGSRLLETSAGTDASDVFHELHRSDVLTRYSRLVVGRLDTADAPVPQEGQLSDVPFAEIPSVIGTSPFFNESHKAFLQGVRKVVQTELVPIASAADRAGSYPERETIQSLCMQGIYVARLGPGPWMQHAEALGIRLPGGLALGDLDYFHEMIAHQEMGRIGLPGFIDSLGAGYMISVPAVFNFGDDHMRNTVGRELLLGNKNSALAISEPFAGSDVAGIKTTAVKTADGKHYIVNGVKKWITEGMFSDYFITAVKTGDGKGAGGMSMLVIPRSEGVETRQIKTTYSTCAGTALVIFQDVLVPVTNLLGKEHQGFKLVMYNFNHERWAIVQSLLGQARAAITDTFLWANQRKVFGKALIQQPVIRNKLAGAIAALEAVQSYSENLTYTMCNAKDGPLGSALAGPIALLKYQATRTGWRIADDTVQIFGGRGITNSGMGAKVEGFKNYAKYGAVYGGSEEIMADLAIRQALRNFPQNAKL